MLSTALSSVQTYPIHGQATSKFAFQGYIQSSIKTCPALTDHTLKLAAFSSGSQVVWDVYPLNRTSDPLQISE